MYVQNYSGYDPTPLHVQPSIWDFPFSYIVVKTWKGFIKP
jgi:hypothetical protein